MKNSEIKTTKNYMLDNVVESFKKSNVSDNDLIKTMAIQKIEYGRTCLAQFVAQKHTTLDSQKDYYEQLDGELKTRIMEIGGEPEIISL